jgi:imidazolonepropionase-like amidohydrolase
VLDGKRLVQHHSHRADDIMTVLRLAEEFGYQVVIQHGTEAWKVADELAARNIPVSTIVLDSPGGKQEALGLTIAAPARLAEAGVKVAIHTDDFIVNSRFLLRSAALAIRGGLDEATALQAITQNAADMLGLGERLGSLAIGKDADFVILDGPPFSVYTRVDQTWIEGEKVFDRSRPEDLRYATGGFLVADRYPGSGDEK